MPLILTQVYLDAKQKKTLAANAKDHRSFMAEIARLRTAASQ